VWRCNQLTPGAVGRIEQKSRTVYAAPPNRSLDGGAELVEPLPAKPDTQDWPIRHRLARGEITQRGARIASIRSILFQTR